jgi:hypothetical protein
MNQITERVTGEGALQRVSLDELKTHPVIPFSEGIDPQGKPHYNQPAFDRFYDWVQGGIGHVEPNKSVVGKGIMGHEVVDVIVHNRAVGTKEHKEVAVVIAGGEFAHIFGPHGTRTYRRDDTGAYQDLGTQPGGFYFSSEALHEKTNWFQKSVTLLPQQSPEAA